MTEPEQSPVVTLRENRFPLFSLVLVLLAFCLAAYVVYLNYEVTRVASAQLVRAQQLQSNTQTRFMEQYAGFLQQQAKAARFERSFQVRQQHYAAFMGGLQDAWRSVGRKDREALDDALNQLAKAYYGLEPFLAQGDRLYLQKRIKIFHNLAQQLLGYEQAQRGIIMEDKTTMDRMIDDFQQFLFPLLFDPAANEEAPKDENQQTDR
ncbi:MAG: hypothetical protein CML06_10880 [Pseudomonadales bacterium]|nr:hypothetical protein [Pseudomonadales bacterium]